MKHVAVGIAVVIAFVVVGIAAYQLTRGRGEEAGGFRDWVKNPDRKRSAAEYFAAREALEVPDDLADEEIQSMVDRLFVQKDDDFNLDRLELVGERAVPMLIEALDDPRASAMRFGDDRHLLAAGSPFERIAGLLGSVGSPDAAPALAKYVQHEDAEFRKEAAMALGNIGTRECIAPMVEALRDDDDYVRSYAMMGIQRGIEAERCTPDFLDAMFPALTELLNRPDRSISGGAPALLLEIDEDRALAVLLSPKYFTVENREVQYIVRALNVSGHRIPHENLLPFLEAVRPLVDEYPHDYAYAEALRAYAHNADARTEQTLRRELESPSEKVREAAAESLAVLAGVTNARNVVFDAVENRGFDGLTIPQRHYFAVAVYDAEVNNGGHSQFFVNSSGDHWKSALEGLRAIGADERAGILQEAVVLFGPAGPSEDNDRRHQQLARFTGQQEKSLDALDSSYYACDENVDVLLARFSIENRSQFIPPE